MEPELTQEHIDYLNQLRDSGITNMWGAAPYLELEFSVSNRKAKKILMKWMTHKSEEVVNESNS